MKVTIEGNELVVRLPISTRTSKSGKSLVIASTGGNIAAGVKYDGQDVVIGVNAYIKK